MLTETECVHPLAANEGIMSVIVTRSFYYSHFSIHTHKIEEIRTAMTTAMRSLSTKEEKSLSLCGQPVINSEL